MRDDPAMRVGFIGLGIMGSRQAANLRRAGHELTVCNRTRGEGRGVGRRARRDGRRDARARRPRRRRRDHDGRRRRAGRGRCCSARDGAAAGRADGHAVRRHVDDRARRRRAHRRSARRARGRASSTRRSRAPRPKAEDGTLTIMAGGDERRRRARAAAVRGDGRARSSTPARSGTGQKIKLINNAVAAANAAHARPRRCSSAGATGVDLDALVAGDGRRLGRLGDARR